MKVVLIFLWLMYFLQGIPYGFQTKYLPLLLRSNSLSLSLISFTRMLSLPWILKPLWAPLIDKHGRKTSWVVFSLVGMAFFYLCASFISLQHLFPTMVIITCFNVLASTHDIAVDSIIVDLLATDYIGIGNIAQVVGYKSGLLVGGGILGWLSSTVPWQRIFFLLFLTYLCSAVLVLSPVFSEPTKATRRCDAKYHNIVEGQGEKQRSHKGDGIQTKINENKTANLFKIYCQVYSKILESPGTKWTMIYVLIYKLGEQGLGAIFPMFLIDQGLSVSQTATLTGVWCQTCSIIGSLFGGIIVRPHKWKSLQDTLTMLSLVRLLAAGFLIWCASYHSLESTWLAILFFDCVLHFIAGAITTVTFTLMVLCSRECTNNVSATHYSSLATIEVLGKITMTSIAGSIVENTGYNKFFLICIILLTLPVIILRISNNFMDKQKRV